MSAKDSMRFALIDEHDNTILGYEAIQQDHPAVSALSPKRPLDALEVGQSTPAMGMPFKQGERYWLVRVR